MPAPDTRWSSRGSVTACPASRPTAAWSERCRRGSLLWSPPKSSRWHRQRSGRRPAGVPWWRAEGQGQPRPAIPFDRSPPLTPSHCPEREAIVSQGQPFVRVRGWPIGSAQVPSDNVHKWRRTVPQGRDRPTTPFRRALSWAAALVHIRPWNEDKAHAGRLGRAGHIDCGPRCTVCATVWRHFSSGGASCCGLSSGWDIGIPRPPCETPRTPSRSRTKPSPTTSTRCWGERDRSDMLGRRRGCTPSTTAIVAAKSQSTTSLTGYPPGFRLRLYTDRSPQ